MKHGLSLQGGVVALSSGEDWTDDPGATVIMWNSSFELNTADLDNGGVVNVGEFSNLTVAGDDNVFQGNNCTQDGGVIASTTDSSVVIEGGTFTGNSCEGVSFGLRLRHRFLHFSPASVCPKQSSIKRLV